MEFWYLIYQERKDIDNLKAFLYTEKKAEENYKYSDNKKISQHLIERNDRIQDAEMKAKWSVNFHGKVNSLIIYCVCGVSNNQITFTILFIS